MATANNLLAKVDVFGRTYDFCAKHDLPMIGNPIISGHCLNPQSASPSESHARCNRNGAGCQSPATGLFHPCPCACHLGEEYECGCGGTIREAPMLGLDEDGDEQYVHIEDGRMVLGGCRS